MDQENTREPAPRRYQPSTSSEVKNSISSALHSAQNARNQSSWDTIKHEAFVITWLMISGIFWIIGLIPVVNVFSNILYWILWLGVYIYKFIIGAEQRPSAKKFVVMSTVSLVFFVLGLVPFLDWIPWDMLGTFILILIGKN